MIDLQADANGLVVTNKFVRHRIPWRNVTAIWSRERPTRYSWSRVIMIEQRHSVWLLIAAYSTLGLTADERRRAVEELIALAERNGHTVATRDDS